MSHFYHPTTGELVDGLRAARKVNALPSPTTVLSVLGSYGLKVYFARQMFEAVATTPRPSGMTDDDYFETCQRWADEHGQAARDKGGAVHDAIQNINGMQAFSVPIPLSIAPQVDAYATWHLDNIKEPMAVEYVVIGDGYAGRVDHIARLTDGRVAVLDAKTQDRKERKKFNHYLNWALQLGAYAGAWSRNPDNPRIEVMASVVIESNPAPGVAPVLEVHEWERGWEYYHGLFMGLLKVWSEDNNYFPEQNLIC